MKPYLLNSNLEDEVKSEIETIVRESNCFFVTPSNISDPYDLETIRENFLSFDHTEIKALIDVNIFTRIVKLIDGTHDKSIALTDQEIKASAVMCFLIYSGIEVNPTLAILERSLKMDTLTPNQQDYASRILDHLSPKVFSDIALGHCNEIPDQALKNAKKEIDANEIIQENIEKTSFSDGTGARFELIYMNLLMGWLLYKCNRNDVTRLNNYLEWSYSNSLADQMSNIFIYIFLSDKRIPKMLKKANSENCNVVLESIKNTAWDLFHFSGLEYCYMKPENEAIWYFATFDKVLLKCSKYFFKLERLEDVSLFVEEFYSGEAVNFAIDYTNKVNSRTQEERSKHVELVNKSLSNNINELEKKVEDLLAR